MEKVRKINSGIEKFTTGVGYVSFACILGMMLINVIDVILSKVTESTRVLGAYEITQRLLMCAVFASFAYAQSKKAHINMTLIIAKFPRVLRYIAYTITSIISVIAAGAVTYAAYIQTLDCIAKNYVTEVLYIPLWPFYVVEIVAMAIFTLTLLYDTCLSAIAIFNDDYAKMIEEDWS